ncbi:MAG TPA: type II toxin-antitoxin system RelB/DinJ family antitoxin, partial [Bacteroidales bacterium]|nr:type II toxin-antitoxin system RelB/DinJ family antitoxin [Bacteroidales bacterium]
MAKTANVYARIEPELKKEAEDILNALGIPASNAVTMFYKQIVMHKGLPFEVKIPEPKLDFSKLSVEEIDTELNKGYQDYLKGDT